MLDRIGAVARVVLPLLILTAIALAGQAGQRWQTP